MNKLYDCLLSTKLFESQVSRFMSYRANKNVVEHRECWGKDYPDKTFYVIRRPNMWGLMSILTVFIEHISYARRRGWIPVVDMENVSNLYLQEDFISTGINPWEWYFEQPMGYSLKDIAHAKNIVLSNLYLYTSAENAYPIDYKTLVNEKKHEKWRKLAREYYRITPDTMALIDKVYHDVFVSVGAEKVLGVYCRGTDYIDLKPSGHPVQPTKEQVIKKAEDLMEKHHLNFCYLVTEDNRVLSGFREHFGERLLTIDALRYDSCQGEEDWIWKRKGERADHKYLSGLEYLTGMFLLTYCDALCGGVTGGTTGLSLLDDQNYKEMYFWDLGRY